MSDLEIAKLYFELSNKSNFDEIEKLFSDTTIYYSQNTGKYFGKDSIIKMQRSFHEKYKSLNWKINSSKTLTHGTIVFNYDFRAKLLSGDSVKTSGLEFITIDNGLISRVEIQSKP
jgi:hypothetical protein